jgi:Flp pilus assembly pilin Flp
VNDLLTRLHVLYRQRERGQTMAEYALVLGIITLSIVLALGALGGSISGALDRVTSNL